MTRICLRPLPLAFAVALAFLAPAHAQTVGSATPASISIGAQPLAQALNEFARQTGMELIVQPSLAAGKSTRGVSGSLTPRQALDGLLAGTGLQASIAGKAAVIAAAAPSAEPTLPPVTVTADTSQESADGTRGYVARRSASGTKTETPVLETPQAISVVTRQQLEDQKPRSIPEALNYTPGTFTGMVGSSNRYDYVALRGFADSSVDNAVLDGLKMLSDQGTYLSMQVDPFFLERIDVVRGPASVLYGRASPGGLVALTSRKPQFQSQREVQLTVGNNARRELGVDLTGPLDQNGVAAFRLTALTRKMDSQFRHVEEERHAIAPSLALNLSPNTHLLLQAYLQRDPEGSYHSGIPYDASVNTARNGRRISRNFFDGDPDVDKFERDQRFLGYQFEHAFNDQLKFRQNFRHVKADNTLRQVYQAGWADSTTLNRAFSGADEETEGFTIDNQLEARFRTGAVEHTLLGGVDYQKRHVEGDWTWGGALPVNPYDPDYSQLGLTVDGGTSIDRHLRQTGIYLQDQLAIGGWRFTVGGRQDRAKVSNGGFDVTARWSGSKFTKRLGAVYLFDNGLAPYVSYADGFNPSLRRDVADNNLPPEESEQTEIGIRYQPKGSNTLLSAALYTLEQENVASMPTGSFFYVPAGKVRSRGLELEARTQLTRSMSMLASYTYTDMEFLRSPAGNEGNTPYQAPRHMASVWGDWTFMPGYTLGGGVRYVGSSQGDNENTFKVASYTLADLMLRVDLSTFNPAWRGADLRLSANNLFDKRYVSSCISQSYCYWGDERNVMATLSYKW